MLSIKTLSELLKESVGYLLCVVYCLSVCIYSLEVQLTQVVIKLYVQFAKHWDIISLIEKQFSCSLKYFNYVIFSVHSLGIIQTQ